MMGMIALSDSLDQAPKQKAIRRPQRSDEELAMRDCLEVWARSRWPAARILHELVIFRGTVRADLAAVTEDHIVAFEIKSPYDEVTRLIHQAGLFQMAAPEVWIVTTEAFAEDAALVRYVMPSVGELRITGLSKRPRKWDEKADFSSLKVEVVAEPNPLKPIPKALLSMPWADELREEATRYRLLQSKTSRPIAHAKLVDLMVKLTPEEQMEAVCRCLRAREGIWRADPAIRTTEQEPSCLTSI